jgi:hypothetical protein
VGTGSGCADGEVYDGMSKVADCVVGGPGLLFSCLSVFVKLSSSPASIGTTGGAWGTGACTSGTTGDRVAERSDCAGWA